MKIIACRDYLKKIRSQF